MPVEFLSCFSRLVIKEFIMYFTEPWIYEFTCSLQQINAFLQYTFQGGSEWQWKPLCRMNRFGYTRGYFSLFSFSSLLSKRVKCFLHVYFVTRDNWENALITTINIPIQLETNVIVKFVTSVKFMVLILQWYKFTGLMFYI